MVPRIQALVMEAGSRTAKAAASAAATTDRARFQRTGARPAGWLLARCMGVVLSAPDLRCRGGEGPVPVLDDAARMLAPSSLAGTNLPSARVLVSSLRRSRCPARHLVSSLRPRPAGSGGS